MENESPRLSALLAELHAELSRIPAAGMDDERRAHIDDLRAEIERLQAGHGNAGDDRGQGQHLRDRLQTAVASFEGAHPQIAAMLEQTMNALSNMGL